MRGIDEIRMGRESIHQSDEIRKSSGSVREILIRRKRDTKIQWFCTGDIDSSKTRKPLRKNPGLNEI